MACSKYRRVVATGGSSTNPVILQILADVFQAPVYTIDCKDSACMGAAIRAYQADVLGEEKDGESAQRAFERIFQQNSAYHLACSPNPATKEVYDEMVEKVRKFENMVIKSH